MKKIVLICLISSLTLAACETNKNNKEENNEVIKTEQTTKSSKDKKLIKHKVDWSDTWHDLEVQILSVDALQPKHPKEGETAATSMGVTFSFINNSDHDMVFHPVDEGSITVDDTTRHASKLASTGGFDGKIRAGTTKKGYILYDTAELPDAKSITHATVNFRVADPRDDTDPEKEYKVDLDF